MGRIFAVILITFLIASCSPQAEEIRIGVTATLTGPGANWGEHGHNGLILAQEEINAAGGINGKPVRIIIDDIGTNDLKKASSAVEKFVSFDNVHVILTQWAEDTSVAQPIADREEKLVINYASGAYDIPLLSENVFMIIPSDSSIIETEVAYLLENGYTKGALISTNSAYFEATHILFSNVWAAHSDEDLLFFKSDRKLDYRTEITELLQEDVDFIYLNLDFDSQGAFRKQALELGLDAVYIGQKGQAIPSYLDTAGEAADHILFPGFEKADESFASRYEKRFGKFPEMPAEYSYDALYVIKKAIESNGESTDELRTGLLAIQGYKGVSGEISFDENGQRTGKQVILFDIINDEPVQILP